MSSRPSISRLLARYHPADSLEAGEGWRMRSRAPPISRLLAS